MAGFGTEQSFVDGVRALADYDLSFDLCVPHHQLREITTLVASAPDVSFVLDHLGKPPVVAGAHDPWKSDLARLGAAERHAQASRPGD
jgi:L-fuconolactonase